MNCLTSRWLLRRHELGEIDGLDAFLRKRHVDIAMDLGLTLPGMMEEPGCNAGRLISKSPARGPDVRRIRSLEIFESFMARLFNAAE